LNKLANVSSAPFQLYVWPQRLLLLAPAYVSHRHRHHAAQIVFGLDGTVVFETPQTGLHSADLLLIPPDIPHAHPAFGATAMLFLEPESVDWTHFSDRGNCGIVQLCFDHRLRSFALWAAAGDPVAAQQLVDHLIGKAVGESTGFDPMISHACEYIRQRLNRPITLAELARAVHRSPSRLAHRFREATGVPVRRFILWCRLRAAAESAMRGSSLTEAAHAAGFADSAHLSRTFRSMFGIAPSFLFKRGQLDITFLQAP
jgi:AraC-like DNA-binding protein/mannose-6-phosphate isomerase-like protein (cupin superfamily)